MSDQMTDAMLRQCEAVRRSFRIDRRGWTDAQWIADARRLMDELDGAVTSLLNGHVLALLRAAEARPAVDPDALARAKAEALREAADVWQQGEWADAPRRGDRVQERIANAQHVGDWLRARADRIDTTEGSVTDHDFLPVTGHPDDNECTFRSDGTDLTYCAETREMHRG